MRFWSKCCNVFVALQIVIQSIFAGTVSFLPLLDCLCSFDILTYTVPDCNIPNQWDETQPVFIANSQEVQLRSFSTSLHKMDTIVSYKNTWASLRASFYKCKYKLHLVSAAYVSTIITKDCFINCWSIQIGGWIAKQYSPTTHLCFKLYFNMYNACNMSVILDIFCMNIYIFFN